MLEDEVIETEMSSDENVEEKSLGDTLKEAFIQSTEKAETEEPLAEVDEPAALQAEQPKIKAPESWSPLGKSKFSELPLEIQQEINKREEDVHRGFTKFDEERVLGKQMKDVITPYLPMIKSDGGNAPEAVGNLLQTAYILRTGTNESKVEAIRFLCQKFQIDPSPLFQQPQQSHYIDPYVQQLQQQVHELTQAHQYQYQMAEQQEQAQIHETIESFAADPSNKFFSDVRPDMAILLKEGRASDMAEAYTMACWANPNIRPLMLHEEQKQAAELNRKKVNKSRNAAVSVTGSVSGGRSSKPLQDRTLGEEIAEQLRAAQGRI